MKLQLPRRRRWRVAIYLLSLWLVITAIDLVLVQTRREIHPDYETTRIISPTLPDGRIDYIVAVDEHFGFGVTPQNNAAIPALRAWGRSALSPEQPRNGVTDRLGMEPITDNEVFIQYKNYCDAHHLQQEPTAVDLLQPDQEPSWPLKLGPTVRGWVNANESQLKLLTEASLRPRFFIPFYAGNRPETMISVQLRHVGALRETAKLYLTRAAMRLEAGDVPGFREDVLTVHRWARLLSQTHTLIERLVAISLETSACRMDRLAAVSGKLSAADACALATDLERLGDLPSPSETVDAGERYFVLECCQWMARGGPRNVAIFLDQILSQNQVRWPTRAITTFLPHQFRRLHALHERILRRRDRRLAATHLGSTPRGDAALGNGSTTRKRTERRRHLLLRQLAGHLLMPSLTRAMEVSENAHAEIRLTRIALALAAYKSGHGSYPPSLADLPSETPADPFTDKPFLYTPTPAGYHLYSVGPNMIDDHDNNQKPNDDISASYSAPTKP